jgi:quinol monooxygenase YgiN
MSVPVLIGFAGVLVAAVATGMLAGRCVRQPRFDLILWTAATFGLTVALAAQSMGFASGFGATTFRAIQLSALLLVPLWLAWGMVEVVAGSEVARFGMRLISAALMVVASVIVATDPLTAQPFTKSWPSAGLHLQSIALYALDAAQGVAVVAVLVSVGVAVVRGGRDARWRPALMGIAAVGLAVLMTAGLRVSLPSGLAYPLLSMVASVFVWFGASRVQGLGGELSGHQGGRSARVRGSGSAEDLGDGEDGLVDSGDRYRPYEPEGDYAIYGQQGPRRPGPPPEPSGPRGPVRGPGGFDRPGNRPVDGYDQGRRPDLRRGPGAPGPAERRPEPPLAPEAAMMPEAQAPGPPARPYGRILIFTLLDDRVADFDRFAEESAEEVRTREPDTLVYVIHTVPNAPMQRIFYEIYRDQGAFESHERQPYMQRFVAERRSCVLATNVIELRLKYAKVAPLPNPQAAGTAPPPGARAQLPPGQPLGSGPQRLQPLPPARPPRPEQPRPDQPRPEQPRPDQPRPEQPRPSRHGQLPSASRPYGGT